MLLTAAAGLLLFLIWFFENRRRNAHPVPGGLQSDINLPHAEEFELYHNAVSMCSMKVRVCLAELNLPHKSHHVDLIETGAFETTRAKFRRINPAGTVPVLVHNGHPIYESHEQIRYAAEHAPPGTDDLIPETPELKQAMQAWIDRSSLTPDLLENIHKSAGNAAAAQTLPLLAAVVTRIPTWRILEALLFHHDRKRFLLFLALKLRGLNMLGSTPPLDKVISDSRASMHAHLDALEAQLAATGGPWILGRQFTLADVSWLVIFQRLSQVNALGVFLNPGQRPQCQKLWQRLRDRPSFKTAIVDCTHPIVAYGTERLRQYKAADPDLRQLLEGV